MKTFDFTQLGGEGFCQDDIDWIQQGSRESLEGLGSMLGSTGPGVILSGLVHTVSGSNHTITDGYLYTSYGAGTGQVIRVVGGTVSIPGVGVPYITIGDNTTSLMYNDGSSHASIIDRFGTITAGPTGIGVDGVLLEYSRMVSVGVSLCNRYRDAAVGTITVGTPAGQGTVTGTVAYRYNQLANTVSIDGAVSISTPTDCPALPSILRVQIATLPIGPAYAKWFGCFTYFDLVKDANGNYINGVKGIFGVGGNIFIDFVLPDAAVSSYTVLFHGVFSLD